MMTHQAHRAWMTLLALIGAVWLGNFLFNNFGILTHLKRFGGGLMLHQTKLGEAAGNGDLKTVRNLVASGADVNERDDGGETALCYALEGGHIDVADYLYKKGADTNVTDYAGRTMLHRVSTSHFGESFDWLKSHVSKEE